MCNARPGCGQSSDRRRHSLSPVTAVVLMHGSPVGRPAVARYYRMSTFAVVATPDLYPDFTVTTVQVR